MPFRSMASLTFLRSAFMALPSRCFALVIVPPARFYLRLPKYP